MLVKLGCLGQSRILKQELEYQKHLMCYQLHSWLEGELKNHKCSKYLAVDRNSWMEHLLLGQSTNLKQLIEKNQMVQNMNH